MPFSSQTIEVIGVPSDLGANIRGANMGPTAIRNAQLHDRLIAQGLKIVDEGDIAVPVRDAVSENEQKAKFLTTIAKICSTLSQRVYKALQGGRIPLTIGGDHSIAIGSISGVSHWARTNKKKLSLVWFDAHADINTPETSPSGNIHGMPLAALMGQGFSELTSIAFPETKIQAPLTALVGIRSIDEKEKQMCHKMGVRIYTMREIDERGMKAVMSEIISTIIEKSDGVHVSFDLDCVDPQHAPGVSTPVTGGLSHRESHLALEMIADTKRLVAMDFVELNPLADHGHMSVNLVVDFIQSLLGKNIL